MSVIAHQRHAIECALALIPAENLSRTQRVLRATGDWRDDCLTLVGISRPQGSNSGSGQVVGVLGIRGETDQPLHAAQVCACDALVLARAAKPEERVQSTLGDSVLHIVEALEILKIDDDPNLEEGFYVSKLPFSSKYVAC